MTCEWRNVVGYEGNYEVSGDGQVRSVTHKTPSRNRWGDCFITRKGKVLKPLQLGNTKYVGIQLCKNGKIKFKTVHSVVAEAFHGPRPEGYDCAHLDGDPKNNCAANLAWVTKAENQFHRVLHGTSNQGERAHQAVLKASDIPAIRLRRSKGETYASLANEYGVSMATMWGAANRRTWKCVA